MPDIVLELALRRSSGVLAGIVAALAQAGLELKSQKLDRSGTGWLTVQASGDAPDPGALSERMARISGVDRLVRLDVDGETLITDGEPVIQAIDNQVDADDLATLSVSADPSPDATGADDLPSDDGDEAVAGPQPEAEAEPEREPEPDAAAALDDDALFAAALNGQDAEAEQDDEVERAPAAADPIDPERGQTALRRWRRRLR